MLWLTDIPALWQWRLLKNPQEAMRRCALDIKALSRCPTSREQFAREALYLPDSPYGWHFMIPGNESRYLREKYEYTIVRKRLPEGSFYRASKNICIASPELLFLMFANTLSLPLLVKLGDELCGTYTSLFDCEGRDVMRMEPLVTKGSLAKYMSNAAGFAGIQNARRALRFIVEGSASVKESELEMMASLPLRLGGYGMPTPNMNEAVEFDDAARLIAGTLYARCDLCWPEHKLDLEYDGHVWHRGQDKSAQDKARINALQHMGYRVITVTKHEFNDMVRFDAIMKDVAKHIGFRLRGSQDIVREQHRQLRDALRRSSRHAVFQTAPIDGTEETIWD